MFSRIIAAISLVLLVRGFTSASAQTPPPPVIINTPELLVEAPVDPAITIQRIGDGYTLALTNNTAQNIIGLAVRWVGVGSKPQTRLWDSYLSNPPVVSAKGMIVLNPERIEPVVSADQSGRRVISPDTNQRLANVSRVLIRVDVVVFDNGVALGPDDSGLVGNMKARTALPPAEAKWEANKPKVYEFTIRKICFCGPIPPGWEPVLFRVVGSIPSTVSGERTVSYQGLERYNMIEKLFSYIRQELVRHLYKVEVDYDPDLGYPKRIFIDLERNVADDEMTLVIERFTPLTR